AELKALVRHPVLVGPSRKSYAAMAVSRELGREPAAPLDRLGATIAAVLHAADHGADAVRVHDVREVAHALAYRRATIARARGAEPRAGGGASA
ncbi:MAG: hypothetical protein EXR75_02115, partial [Myxococcales bacterium]|nr:hypothetical protein [Myxococcales bacterium]